MFISDYFQLDDLHLLRFRLKPEGSQMQFQVARDFRVQFKLERYVGGVLTPAIAYHDTLTLTVPNGMFTDLASIPQVAQAMISKLGPHIEAAVVHDYLCVRRGDFVDETGLPIHISSRDAADIFHAAMLHGGTDKEQAGLMAFAVKTFGPQWS